MLEIEKVYNPKYVIDTHQEICDLRQKYSDKNKSLSNFVNFYTLLEVKSININTIDFDLITLNNDNVLVITKTDLYIYKDKQAFIDDEGENKMLLFYGTFKRTKMEN